MKNKVEDNTNDLQTTDLTNDVSTDFVEAIPQKKKGGRPAGARNKKSKPIPIPSGTKKNKGIQPAKGKELLVCQKHGGAPMSIDNFYMANNGTINSGVGRIPVCKKCLRMIYSSYLVKTGRDVPQSIYYTCRKIDTVFVSNVAVSSLEEAKGFAEDALGFYFSTINGLSQYKTVDLCFDNSDGVDTASTPQDVLKRIQNEAKLTTEDKRNIKDIKRKLGFDPFESYAYKEYDLRLLYRDLMTYLEDDDLISDSYKLNTIVQIINTQHQIRTLDLYMSSMSNDPSDYMNNLATINAISGQRLKLIQSLTTITKENKWLTVDNSSSKNKLSGMMKIYREYDFDKAHENYFDMLTAEATKTIMDLSNQSIIEQLRFSDSEERELFSIQRELIDAKDKEIMETKEKLRLAHVEMTELKTKLNGGESNG